MVQEGSPFYPGSWDPWSARNQIFSVDPLSAPAPRREGDLEAMQAAYESGLVFRGDVEVADSDAHALSHPREERFANGRKVDERQGHLLSTIAQKHGQPARRLSQPASII